MTGHRLRVLVVDPTEDSADSLALMLNLWGYDVQVAYTGRQALKIAAYHRPHAALMDLLLPDLSAADVAARLRDQATLVALTSVADADLEAWCAAAGFRFVFLRPGSPAGLRLLLEALEWRTRSGTVSLPPAQQFPAVRRYPVASNGADPL